MRRRALSLRGILLLVFSTLTLLIAVQAGQTVISEWQQLGRIKALKEASDLSDWLFTATDNLSFERDVAEALLRTSDAESIRNLKAQMAESREKTDSAMQVMLNMLTAYQFTELVPLQKQITPHLDEIHTMRTQIDQSLELPLAARDKTLASRWEYETTNLIDQTQTLWAVFIGHFVTINPVATLHLRYKQHLRTIVDYTGQQRAIIGRLIAEHADPTPEESATLLRSQGTIESSWKLSRLLANQSGLYAKVGPAYKDAVSHYQNLYGMVKNIFYLPGTKHYGVYPISADLWLELSAQATESLNALKDASTRETQNYILSLEAETRQNILRRLAFILLMAGICAYSFHTLNRRVITPIGQIVEALLASLRGETFSLNLPTRQGDEIDKLAEVLRGSQQNMEAIKEATNRYKALVDASAQVIWVWKEGAIDGMSPLSQWWEETTGQPAAAIATFGWLEVVHPDDRERVKLIWQEAMEKGHNFEMDYRLRAKGGRYVYVAVRGVALKSDDGRLLEFIGSLNDVTAKKEAEAGMQRYMEALERSNKELDDFAYIASHDLKEPLRGIHNHSRFLLEDNQGKLDEESVRKLGRLVYLSQRMERLVNDLLYFSRLGRQELAIQPTDMNEVIHDIETTLELFLTERKARIYLPATLPTLVCDKTRVTELFRNLITNAIKYNDKPEKIVEIGFLAAYAPPDEAPERNVFYVKDNGKGIAPEFHQEIFRIFKRLQSSKETGEEGTGVGLTFVKKIIERHGGRIWLESAPGKGTTFYFTLVRNAV